jgi:hypothetical protein
MRRSIDTNGAQFSQNAFATQKFANFDEYGAHQ